MQDCIALLGSTLVVCVQMFGGVADSAESFRDYLLAHGHTGQVKVLSNFPFGRGTHAANRETGDGYAVPRLAPFGGSVYRAAIYRDVPAGTPDGTLVAIDLGNAAIAEWIYSREDGAAIVCQMAWAAAHRDEIPLADRPTV